MNTAFQRGWIWLYVASRYLFGTKGGQCQLDIHFTVVEFPRDALSKAEGIQQLNCERYLQTCFALSCLPHFLYIPWRDSRSCRNRQGSKKLENRKYAGFGRGLKDGRLGMVLCIITFKINKNNWHTVIKTGVGFEAETGSDRDRRCSWNHRGRK